jgi:hypothetical protein
MSRVFASSLAAAWLLRASIARADDMTTCVTRSVRPASEILVPVSDDSGAPPGVTIDPGETLCLAGSVDPDGRFRPHLVDPVRGEPAVVFLDLMHRHGGTRLLVKSSLRGRLAFRAATIVGPQQLASPLGHDHETSGAGEYELLNAESGLHRWLVYGMERLPEVKPPAPMPPRSLADRTFEVGLEAMGGVRALSLGAFDGPLRASGYAPFPRAFPSAGGAGYFVFGRWRFALWFQYAWGRARARSGSGGVDADLLDFRLAGGYDFLRWRGFTGFVLGGIGAGTFGIDAQGPGWTYLARTGADLGANRISKNAGQLTLQAGFQQIVPLSRADAGMSLFFSLNGGYSQQLGLSGWFGGPSLQSTVEGPPHLDLGGTWVLFGVAIGGDTTRPGGIFSL